PNGTATKDRSSVGITFAKEPPKYELMMNSFANESILVPPHDPHYRAEAVWRMRADARIISVVPHMHWRGKDYRYEALYPDGRRRVGEAAGHAGRPVVRPPRPQRRRRDHAGRAAGAVEVDAGAGRREGAGEAHARGVRQAGAGAPEALPAQAEPAGREETGGA